MRVVKLATDILFDKRLPQVIGHLRGYVDYADDYSRFLRFRRVSSSTHHCA